MSQPYCNMFLTIVWTSAFTLPCAADETVTLIGDWVVTSVESGGKSRDPINFDGMQWVLGKETLEIMPARATPAGLAHKPNLKCTFAVDDTQSPAHFNWTIGEGDKKATINAIYELKGDVLRVCFARRGAPRPGGFDTQGKRSSVYEFKRAKADQYKE